MQSICLQSQTGTVCGYPLFVVLDVYGTYFFAPSFSEYDSYLPFFPSFIPGETRVQVLPEFTWPEGAGNAQGIVWYSGLTDPAMSGLFGEMDDWVFGWGY